MSHAPLSGCYEGRLDEKGRVVLPARLRPRQDSASNPRELVLLLGRAGECVDLLSHDVWSQAVSELASRYSPGDPTSEEYLSDLLSSAQSVSLDGRHRLFIPEVLRHAAGIERDVVFVGVGDRVEIWSAERWGARARPTELPR